MSDDLYQVFLAATQARRRRVEALGPGLGGALGVAADPYPHQLQTVARILGDTRVRHLIADEVGLGKTVQALMVLNALRWQNPTHKAVVLAPDRLIQQWQTECWTRAHVEASVFGDAADRNDAHVRLIRPQSLQDGLFELDPVTYDLLVVDEPQTMPLDVLEAVVRASRSFRQILVLSATPGLSDPARSSQLLKILEPERMRLAELTGQSSDEFFDSMEFRGASTTAPAGAAIFRTFSRNRRIIRSGRRDWGCYLPSRDVRRTETEPLESEAGRTERGVAWALQHGRGKDEIRFAQSLFRSPRSARESIAAQRRSSKAQLLEEAATTAQSSPGDSRLDALIDILREIWTKDEGAQVIVVAGDNPSIDHLARRLPLYFANPDQPLTIDTLRRAGAEGSEADDVEAMHDQLAAFNQGRAKLLLIGEWIQAGLNLHFYSTDLVFYSVPWDPVTIDQLIGRLDRLRPGGLVAAHRGKAQRPVRIWTVTQAKSIESRVIDALEALRVFEEPLPTLSPSDAGDIEDALGRVFRGHGQREPVQELASLAARWREEPSRSRLDHLSPYGAVQAQALYDTLQQAPVIQPVIVKRPVSTFTETTEESFRGLVELLSRMRVFDASPRRDLDDEEFRFFTLYYSGRPDVAPLRFTELEFGRGWMAAHLPYIYRRRSMDGAPRVVVRTDAGEQGGRLLRFLDHGDSFHDTLLEKLIDLANRKLGPADRPACRTVLVPPDHPLLRYQGKPVLLLIAACEVGGTRGEGFQPEVFRRGVESAPTERQRATLKADVDMAGDWSLADQRWLRQSVASLLLADVSVLSSGVWSPLPEQEAWQMFDPFVAGENNACARQSGRTQGAAPAGVRSGLAAAARRMTERIGEHWARHKASLLIAYEERKFQIDIEAADLIAQLDAEVQRRKSQPEVEGQEQFKAGRVAAAERRLKFTRTLLQDRQDRLALSVEMLSEGRPAYQSLVIQPAPLE